MGSAGIARWNCIKLTDSIQKELTILADRPFKDVSVYSESITSSYCSVPGSIPSES